MLRGYYTQLKVQNMDAVGAFNPVPLASSTPVPLTFEIDPHHLPAPDRPVWPGGPVGYTGPGGNIEPEANSGSENKTCDADPKAAGGFTGASLAAAIQFFAAAQCALGEPWPRQAIVENGTRFDFIVVGGGTGGSVVASRLAEIPNISILVIEAGSDPPKDTIIPGFHSTMMGGAYDWNLTAENEGIGAASQALLGGSQRQPRGKVLGGTGSLNDMVYARGFPADYDEWAETLGDDWKWDNVLPYFKKTEHLTDERIIKDPKLMELHGRNGEIEVSGLNSSTFETEMFLKAFNDTGFKLVKDMTNPKEIGAGRHSHTIRDGQRDSTLTALLNKADQKSENIFVLRSTLATKILIANNQAYGVEVIRDEQKFVYYAKMDIILSAGTFHTPHLLMLSGIGPAEHLSEKEIKVVKDLPVGKNLHDHIMVLNYIEADNGTCYLNPAESHMNMIRYMYDRSGPLSVVDTMAAYMALNTSSQPNVPDFAFYPSCTPMGTPFYASCTGILRLKETICRNLDNILKTKELIAVATVNMKPKSRGRVELKTNDPEDDPKIYPGTFSDEDDLRGYPEATKVVKRLVETPYFKRMNAKFVEMNIEVCAGITGDELIECKSKALAMSAWHPVGTAAMGTVVDSELKVIGIEDLRVVDASVMPKVIRGNTNAPVVMIAEKAADYIKRYRNFKAN
ncbi:GMC oxidoreductase domain-containing protein [Phthorimaea operculella]|nr:GMC oxidoreductase domain-containing protein [Phthorimaea operculella]